MYIYIYIYIHIYIYIEIAVEDLRLCPRARVCVALCSHACASTAFSARGSSHDNPMGVSHRFRGIGFDCCYLDPADEDTGGRGGYTGCPRPTAWPLSRDYLDWPHGRLSLAANSRREAIRSVAAFDVHPRFRFFGSSDPISRMAYPCNG